MEKVTIYRLSNGMEVAGESVATLGQQIIDTTKQVKELNAKLKELKDQCSCEYKVKSGSPSTQVRTITNAWGEDCGETYTSQPYSCKICGRDWYHHIEDDEWYKW